MSNETIEITGESIRAELGDAVVDKFQGASDRLNAVAEAMGTRDARHAAASAHLVLLADTIAAHAVSADGARRVADTYAKELRRLVANFADDERYK